MLVEIEHMLMLYGSVDFLWRDSSVGLEHWSHNPEVEGSNPSPATNKKPVEFDRFNFQYVIILYQSQRN